MHGQLLVEHREVGLDEMARAEVLLDQLAEVGPRFGDHRVLQVRIEFGIEFLIRIGRGDLSQLQPLAEEVVDEPLRLRGFQQAFDFRLQDVWLM